MGGNTAAFNAGQLGVLEDIARGAPLAAALEGIVRLIEAQAPGMTCSILLLDRATQTLRHGAAPNLPPEYVRSLNGSAIGREAGSCGAAACRREPVVVEDIATHPYWTSYRDLALPHGLRACWSTPIFSPEHEVLGTFAMYYGVTRRPTEDEQSWVGTATHLASIAIGRSAAEQALRQSEARARQLTRLYSVSSSVSEALVRMREPARLYTEACRIAVEHRLALLAWVGLYREADDRFEPVARFGIDQGYVDGIQLCLEDPRINRGPAARAMRTGAPALSNDIASDDDFFWRAEALARGLRSCAVFPLRHGARIRGVFALYGESPGFFCEEEVAVLSVLADDIAFAVESSENDAERQRLFATLRLVHDVGDALRANADPGETVPIALDMLTRHLHASRSGYAELEAASADRCAIAQEYGAQRWLAELLTPESVERLRRGEPVLTRDLPAPPATWPTGERRRAAPMRASLLCAIVRQGALRAVLAVQQDEPRDFRAEDVRLVQEIAERCWVAAEQRASDRKVKRMEEQLRQGQKMEAIGRLASGVAHDFNNLLSVILSYASFVAEDLEPDDPRCRDIDEIRKAGERAEQLTRQLLALGRQQVLEPRVIALDDIVTGLEPMLRRLIGEDVALSIRTPPTLGRVLADPGQIEQIVMNLLVNARDAMPEGGAVSVEIGDVLLDAAYASEHHGVNPGPYVMLAVSDTGVGMDRETRARVFEPFFTTKELGKGTGLGLSTVYGIVSQSAGHVWVYSEPGLGTTFKVYLPRVDDALHVSHVETSDVARHGSETVLVVEDDDKVRATVSSILQRDGYRVLEARDGTDALLVAGNEAESIDLLLTDVVMPGLSGRELGAELAQRRPDMRILYMSGYTEDAVVRHRALEPGAAFITKPITPDILRRKLHEVFAESRPAIPARSRAPRVTVAPSATRRHVLHVDDEEALVHLTARILERRGHRVSSFTDPEVALSSFRLAPASFDALITDVRMPLVNGFELVRRVWQIRRDLPVIVTSGSFQAEDVHAARSMNIRHLVTKSESAEELGRALDDLFVDGG